MSLPIIIREKDSANNPGKGLSTGLADNTNLNASIESAYLYLHEVKKLSDEDIIAKGQCFGAAPTGWLGKEHPQINIIMDQNLANFHEMAMEIIKSTTSKLIERGKTRKEVESLKPKVQEFLDLEESIRQIIGINSEKHSTLNKEYEDLYKKRIAIEDPFSDESNGLLELLIIKGNEIRALQEKKDTTDEIIKSIKDRMKEIANLEDKIQKLKEADNRSEIYECIDDLEAAKEDLADLERNLFKAGGTPIGNDQFMIQEAVSKMLTIVRKDPTTLEASSKYVEKVSELGNSRPTSFEAWAPYIIRLNYIIEGVVRAIFSGYNTADDIRANRGNKLIHINVPGINGGGDELVLPHHPELMIDSASLSESESQKIIKLSMNPGGEHVTPWWFTSESQEAVMDFFKKTDFLADLTETATEFGQVYGAVPTQFSSLE